MTQQSYAAQALDVALKHSTSMNPRAQAFARAFFWPDPTKVRPLGGGAEVASVRAFGRAPEEAHFLKPHSAYAHQDGKYGKKAHQDGKYAAWARLCLELCV